MNWKIVYISLFGVLLTAGHLNGQSVAFLEVAPDARTAALGEAGTALSPDAWAVFWNVAKATMAQSKTAIAYSYSPWMKELKSGSRLHRVGGYWQLTDKDAIVVGYRHFANGMFELTDNYGVIVGEVNPYEYALEAGYARRLIKKMSIGATVRYIRSDMGSLQGLDPANGVAFDMGLFYQTEVTLLGQKKSELTLGLTMADLGSRIQYAESEYALPTRLALGAAITHVLIENHTLQCAANTTYRMTPSDSRVLSGGLGLEYGIYNIGFLRAGYRWNNIEKNAGGDYVSLGAGVKFRHLSADAAWRLAVENYDPLDKTFTFSVGINF